MSCGSPLGVAVSGTPPPPGVPPVPGPAPPAPPTARPGVPQYAEHKNPAVALVLSLLIVGLGQLYNGDVKKGVLMFAGAFVGGILTLGLVWLGLAIWAAVDAYNVASRKSPLWT